MPKLSPVPSSESWLLVDDWHYTSLAGERFEIPAGFVTDLDSVPRIPFVYALFKGRVRVGALLHDWLYKNGVDRLKADKLLIEVGEIVDRVAIEYLNNIYNAVRAFGWTRYRVKKNEKITIVGSVGGGVVDAKKVNAWVPPESAAPYVDDIAKAEKQNGIPFGLLARLLYQESHYRDDIIKGQTVSHAGAVGIAQIVPRWHPNVDPLNPVESIYYAAEYLARLKSRFGDWETALASYNWGQGNVSKAQSKYGDGWLSHAPAETQNYVNQISADALA
ncbi:transglycosylase SLT domain-containing protein [Marinomonas sp. 2405UD68-3]|uniref:transglycosylase SLT domain-containing protein n=1 Tax=Marinomonas sp. 2405UD68-3 TaxID=3391835 RepID=UPI0039C9AF9B